ncbi:MAG: tetratricopeptide repeat protein [Bacteroidales bacterium]|nr:tetratricopeptide repeat protein [Clostridium sp.]MCM1202818.1 tetratricopeptide repeat protein [Bacteroidales bacterium]
MIWKILGIEQTKDEEVIKAAYREKLRGVNPEDDEEGFKELRRAYEEALEYVNEEETDSLHNTDEEDTEGHAGKKDEVDLWIDGIDEVYRDAATRGDEKKWEALLNDSVCDDLDTELEAAEKLLVYFMSHTFMPQKIWQMVDKRFHYLENYEQLKERFPENYLDYVKWQIESPNFIDFGLFSGKTDDRVDEFINKLYEVKSISEEGEIKKLRQALNELGRFEVTHPFVQVEEARYLLKKAEQEESRVEDSAEAKEALAIMEDLDFEYSDNPYIERIYAETLIANGKIDKAKAVYDGVLEKSPDNYTAMLGQANCMFLSGDAENAKEQVEDVLEERVQDSECLSLLDKINEELVKDYEAKISVELDRDICFKLGWCYYQQKRFDEGLKLLERLGPGEDYDYINLQCRLYLANEDYERAYPLSEKWLALIESSEDDGSREMMKRKNRFSLALFSVGVCVWEEKYKKAKEEKKQAAFSEGVDYIKRAISGEKNLLVKLSYMEQLGRFYLDAKKYEECISVCNEIIEKDRGFFPAYVHRQKANYELRNAKEVIDDYFACQEIYPAYAPPYVLAAEVFFAFEQYDDVEQVIVAAKEAELDSDSLELYRIKCLHYKEFSRENVVAALKAIEALRDKVKKRKDDEETDIEYIEDLEKEYAILYWDMDDTEKTLSIIEAFLKTHPNHPEMLRLKVDVLSREGHQEEALKVCRQLMDIEPDNLHTKMKLGNCYERMEETGKAIQCYNEILTVNPEFAPALRRMMYIYSYQSNQEGDLKKCREAIGYADRFIEVTGSAEGYVERGNLYIDVYELEKAVEDCKKAIELDEEAYYAYNNLGCALLKLRRINEAIEPLKQAIIMDRKKDYLPYLNLAECYVLNESYGKAIETYEQALKLRPNAIRWREEIAKIYVLKKDYRKAVSIYQELLEEIKQRIKKMKWKDKLKFYTDSEPTQENRRIYDIYCEMAEIYRQAGNTEMAEKYYGKVESPKVIKGECCSPLGQAAEYYRDKGELKRAKQIIKNALQKMCAGDRNTRAHRQLFFIYATVLMEMGNKAKAAKYADAYLKALLEEYGGEEKLLEDKRYRPMHLYDLAIMNICAGRLDRGREYLKQITDCHLCVTCETCDCFEYYFGMGLIAELEGDKEEAKRLLERAVKIKGDYPCAKRHLDRM